MLVFAAGAAHADPTYVPICPTGEGPALSGTHTNLTITGNAHVNSGASLKVKGTLTLAPNACLDAFSMSTVTVTGNVIVERGAILGLGCGLGAIEPGSATPCTGSTSDKVGGDIIANGAWTMYLTADRITGDVVSTGGGPGVTYSPYVNFPIKENKIGGNLACTGNSPAAQAGDAAEAPGAHPNVVHGSKIGECTAV